MSSNQPINTQFKNNHNHKLRRKNDAHSNFDVYSFVADISEHIQLKYFTIVSTFIPDYLARIYFKPPNEYGKLGTGSTAGEKTIGVATSIWYGATKDVACIHMYVCVWMWLFN